MELKRRIIRFIYYFFYNLFSEIEGRSKVYSTRKFYKRDGTLKPKYIISEMVKLDDGSELKWYRSNPDYVKPSPLQLFRRLQNKP